jgi:hypothetical protein
LQHGQARILAEQSPVSGISDELGLTAAAASQIVERLTRAADALDREEPLSPSLTRSSA